MRYHDELHVLFARSPNPMLHEKTAGESPWKALGCNLLDGAADSNGGAKRSAVEEKACAADALVDEIFVDRKLGPVRISGSVEVEPRLASLFERAVDQQILATLEAVRAAEEQ